MTLDLDAIRARDARGDFGPEDALQACIDRRALLAEVDRLRASVAPNIADIIRARDAERARIRAAVEGLRDLDKLSPMEQRVWAEACAAVLAAIDGGEK